MMDPNTETFFSLLAQESGLKNIHHFRFVMALELYIIFLGALRHSGSRTSASEFKNK